MEKPVTSRNNSGNDAMVVQGVGMSTLNKWVTAHRDTDLVSKEDLCLAQENDRLRRENRILKEERDILKNYPGIWPACAR